MYIFQHCLKRGISIQQQQFLFENNTKDKMIKKTKNRTDLYNRHIYNLNLRFIKKKEEAEAKEALQTFYRIAHPRCQGCN